MKAKIYNMPNSYIKRNRFTALFLNLKSNRQEFICWYIGPDSGRLIGLYWDISKEKVIMRPYFQNNGVLEYDKEGEGWVVWQDVWDNIRISPEVYCAEYMAFFLGIQAKPPKKDHCKILQFPSARKINKSKTREKKQCTKIQTSEL